MGTASGAVTASATRQRSFQETRAELARRGEDLVAARLANQGFEIVDRNVQVGRLELDIIARRGALVVVCEVRSRRSSRIVFPADTIVGEKLNRIRRATAMWLRRERLGKVRVRIDAAAVVFEGPRHEPRVEYYENVSMPFRSV